VFQRVRARVFKERYNMIAADYHLLDTTVKIGKSCLHQPHQPHIALQFVVAGYLTELIFDSSLVNAETSEGHVISTRQKAARVPNHPQASPGR
jgi:hypothetical protein